MSSSLEDINLNSPVHRGTNASPEASGQDSAPKPKRVPRRIIHCSDGVIEEYSTDDEQADGSDLATESKMASPKLDTKTLAWMPWMIHHTWFAGSTILSYCDFWGEKLAWIFGITSPKYYYEIEEFKRIEEEEKERMARQDAEMQEALQLIFRNGFETRQARPKGYIFLGLVPIVVHFIHDVPGIGNTRVGNVRQRGEKRSSQAISHIQSVHMKQSKDTVKNLLQIWSYGHYHASHMRNSFLMSG
ncbi:hypothetical protein TCAL_10847 [Tigriopus californicus]|uniref:Protein FAM177A1 n=1 Tax=Tigriopus californicus TaxID=6832 RepID=A0A553PKZ2_TIGCA|nr:hypothetical protein TCAL_10847 [Tigriopus californicus]